jgi:hypothetical protein
MHAIHHRYADIGGQQLFYRKVADQRIDIRGTSRHLVVRQQSRVIADSTRPTVAHGPGRGVITDEVAPAGSSDR